MIKKKELKQQMLSKKFLSSQGNQGQEMMYVSPQENYSSAVHLDTQSPFNIQQARQPRPSANSQAQLNFNQMNSQDALKGESPQRQQQVFQQQTANYLTQEIRHKIPVKHQKSTDMGIKTA